MFFWIQFLIHFFFCLWKKKSFFLIILLAKHGLYTKWLEFIIWIFFEYFSLLFTYLSLSARALVLIYILNLVPYVYSRKVHRLTSSANTCSITWIYIYKSIFFLNIFHFYSRISLSFHSRSRLDKYLESRALRVFS